MKIVRTATVVLLFTFFGVFLVLPLYTILLEGLQPIYLLEAVQNPVYVSGFINAFKIATVVTVLVAVVSIPMAMIAHRYDFPLRSWTNALVLLPLILPPFVGALGVQQLFERTGAFNSLLTAIGLVAPGQGPDWLGQHRFAAVCLLEALHLYPILYLNVRTSLANIDPAMDEAARNLGASEWERLRTITLPLIRPGLFAGGVIVFIWSFTELGTPLMLGYLDVTPAQIFAGIGELNSNPTAYSLVVVLLVVSSLLYFVGHYFLGRAQDLGSMKSSSGAKPAELPHAWQRWGVTALFIGLSLLAIFPHFGVLLLSVSRDWHETILPSAYTLRFYQDAVTHDFAVPSIGNSVLYASIATCGAVVLGLLVALVAVRWKPPGWRLLDGIAMLPLAVPGIILAFGYLSMATRYDWLRSWLDPIENPTLLLIIAYGTRRLPYVLRAATAGLQQTPEDLERAAANLGAKSFTVLSRITIPLIFANLIGGMVFAFSFSMLEVSDSLILAQKMEYFPITRAIYELSMVLGSGPYIACAFGVWAMAFLGCSILFATRMLGDRMGAMFRL